MLTLDDLIHRFRNTEDPFVERKVASDIKDVLKTGVAFANSLPDGATGVLFIPVKDTGETQDGLNLDSLQQKCCERLNQAYPPLPYLPRIVRIDGIEVIAIEVYSSPDRPHFAGGSYVRQGSETIRASPSQFDTLIAVRSSKTRLLHSWLGREVTVYFVGSSTEYCVLVECNQFFIGLRRVGGKHVSGHPIHLVSISHDYDRAQPLLIVAST